MKLTLYQFSYYFDKIAWIKKLFAGGGSEKDEKTNQEIIEAVKMAGMVAPKK